MALKTDYKDYIPPSGGRKYKITANSDGSSSVEDITQYQQVGDTWGAEDINQVNKLVNGAVYPNLGTNTNFPNPVNQRGATSYTGDGTSPYCIDRWRISNGTTYTVGTFTLSAATYANRACGMWQSNEMGAHQLSIGDDITVSIYANGKLHTPTMKVIDRDLYDAFTNVPAGYDCDDFEIVLCTYAHDKTKYNLGIYPKKPLTVNYIKWEKGSVATPYVPKGYGAELAECQRYFKRVGNRGFRGWATNETNVVCCLTLATQMRVNPTITPVGTLTAYDEVSSVTVTMDSSTGSTVDTARITAHGTGLTAFRPYSLLGNVYISADL